MVSTSTDRADDDVQDACHSDAAARQADLRNDVQVMPNFKCVEYGAVGTVVKQHTDPFGFAGTVVEYEVLCPECRHLGRVVVCACGAVLHEVRARAEDAVYRCRNGPEAIYSDR